MEPYIVSARKYRPSTFASVLGQKALTATLKNAVATRQLAGSYLFCGSRGVGKTTCARIFAKAINCEHRTPDGEPCNECPSCKAFNAGSSMNILELDAASNNSVDNIRELIQQVQVPPATGSYRVFIVDEVHMLSTAAFNAFLKTLEEPPSYAIFILATTEKHKIIPTILSRCQIYDFHRITVADMVAHLTYVASQEGIKAEPEALGVIAHKADGAMRDALSIFDQIAASTRGNITYAAAIENLNVLDAAYYGRLLDAFLDADVMKSWLIFKEIRDKGFDSQFMINGLAQYMRDLMAARQDDTLALIEGSDQERADLRERASRCTPGFLYRAMALCNEADLNYRISSGKQFLIELTLAKICQSLSPSPNNGSDGEGQLKPITAARAPMPASPAPTAAQPEAKSPGPSAIQAPQAPAPTAASAPAPGATVAPRTPTFTPAPRGGRGRVITSSRVSLSGESPAAHTGPAATPGAPQSTQHRNEPFTEFDLEKTWEAFIEANPREHILVNTMRASKPTPIGPGRYEIAVYNGAQIEAFTAARPRLLQFLRDALHNDDIDLTAAITANAPPRHALSDRELLNELMQEDQLVRRLVDDLQLSLS